MQAVVCLARCPQLRHAGRSGTSSRVPEPNPKPTPTKISWTCGSAGAHQVGYVAPRRRPSMRRCRDLRSRAAQAPPARVAACRRRWRQAAARGACAWAGRRPARTAWPSRSAAAATWPAARSPCARSRPPRASPPVRLRARACARRARPCRRGGAAGGGRRMWHKQAVPCFRQLYSVTMHSDLAGAPCIEMVIWPGGQEGCRELGAARVHMQARRDARLLASGTLSLACGHSLASMA